MYLTAKSPRQLPSFPNLRFSGGKSRNLDSIARAFDENLLIRLKPLIPTTSSPVTITLALLSSAVDLLSSTHNHAVTLFSDLKSSSNLDGSFGLYLDESVKLLDICNSISSEIEQLRKGKLLLNFVLHLLGSSDQVRQFPAPENLLRARDCLSDWSNSSSGLKKNSNLENAAVLIGDLAGKLENPPRGKINTVEKLTHHVNYGVVAVTVLVTGVMISALTGSGKAIRVRVPGNLLWSEAFNRVETAVVGETLVENSEERKRRLIDDLDDVDRRVKRVCDVIDCLAGSEGKNVEEEVERLVNGVKELRRVSKGYLEGLDGLFNGVNVLFNTVLCAREGVLEKFRLGPDSKLM